MGPGMFDGVGRAIGCMLLLILIGGVGVGVLVVKVPQWMAERRGRECHEQASGLRTERDSLRFLVAHPKCQATLNFGGAA